MDRRLFMRFLAYSGCADPRRLVEPLREAGVEGVLYADAIDPLGVGLLTIHEDPSGFVDPEQRMRFEQGPWAELMPRPAYAFFGRTYAIGYEPDLQEVLFDRPRRHALSAEWPWAVWYPLRRTGAFERLEREKKMAILREHGTIGRAWGEAELARDVRLACHGLDPNDNDFVIGLVGARLQPLSALVQTMRGTEQTAEYIERLGPFFVGRAVWQSEPGA